MPSPLTIAILAAGASARMGGADKTQQTVAGLPLLRLLAIRALMTGCPVRVLLPPDHPSRRTAVADLPLRRVIVPDAARGMSAAFRALAAEATGPVMVMLADMPQIRSGDLSRLIAAHRGDPSRIVRGAAGTRPGHPVVFPAALVPRFAGLRGDEGARQILGDAPQTLVDLADDAAVTDLDTPAAWAAWRQRTGWPS